MKSILTLALWAIAVAFPVAQATENSQLDRPVEPILAVLEPSSPVVMAGETLTLTLRVTCGEATQLDRTVLSGNGIVVRTGDDIVRNLEKRVAGTVRVAARTTITREIPLDFEDLFERRTLPSSLELTIAWKGLSGASCSVQLVADQSDIVVDDLDLTKTKVRLITNFGEMVVKFFPDKAPGHVKNFIKLSKDGFYNGTRFHRIIKNFMIQGGCPNTKAGAEGPPGSGGPGYQIDAEFNDRKHVRGILSMARSRSINSAGSQFFIMHGEAPALDGQYTIFGELESGYDTLDEIADVRVRPNARGEASVPTVDVNLYAAIVEPVDK